MKDIIHGKGLMLKFFTPNLNSAIIVKTWGHGVAKKCNISKLGFKVLKKCKISELWLPSLEKYFQMCSCLGRPSHERHNSWQGSNVESLYPKVSRLGKPSLEYGNHCQVLGTWSCKKVTVQDMGYCQVLKEKCKISELLWLTSLDNHVHLCSCLGRPSHERHNSWQGSDVEILCPEKFQDLESQVLNSAVIVKTWGHGVAKNVHFKTWNTKPWKKDFRTWSAKSWKYFQMCACLGRQRHERPYLYCWNSLAQKVSRVGKPSLE